MNRALGVIIDFYSAGSLCSAHNRMDGKCIRCKRGRPGILFRRHGLGFRGLIRLAVHMIGADRFPGLKLRQSDLNRDLLLRLDLVRSVVKPEIEIIGGHILRRQLRVIRRGPERVQNRVGSDRPHGHPDSLRERTLRRVDPDGCPVVRLRFQKHRRTGALFLYKAVGRSRRRFLLPGTG